MGRGIDNLITRSTVDLGYARGLAVMMGASQALDPGSTPGGRTNNKMDAVTSSVPPILGMYI